MTKYGLTVDGKLLGYSTRGTGDSNFCGSTENTLGKEDYENVWLVDSPGTAAFVAEHSTDWYNAGHDTPKNPYVGKCKLVRVTLSVEEIEL